VKDMTANESIIQPVMTSVLVNGLVFDGQQLRQGLAVVVENDRVIDLLPEKQLPDSIDVSWDLNGHILAPGLIDIQVNGGGGVMFNDDPSVETIRGMGAAHRQFGTTGFMPTLISTDLDTISEAMSAVGQAISEAVPGVLGIHLEGPFLNAEKRGIHDENKFRELDEAAFELLSSLDQGKTLVTLAPEKTTAKMISRLTASGVLVFGGHSNATYQQTRLALNAGLRGFTHLFNAMSPFKSREPGMVGAALEDENSWCGIIADGHHVHPASFALAVKAKKRGHSILVTDAMAAVGSTQKSFVFDGLKIQALDGCCRTPGGHLAGSDLDMISAVRNAIRFAGLSQSEALRMASTYPARALGLETQLGAIRAGFKASFVELDEDLNLYRTWINGEVNT
jgi:N-acetylglucosamine-6-phosphate deacetylase